MKIQPYEERYSIKIPGMSVYDNIEVVKGHGRLKVYPLTERWRTPKETIKYYAGIIKAIEKNFV